MNNLIRVIWVGLSKDVAISAACAFRKVVHAGDGATLDSEVEGGRCGTGVGSVRGYKPDVSGISSSVRSREIGVRDILSTISIAYVVAQARELAKCIQRRVGCRVAVLDLYSGR